MPKKVTKRRTINVSDKKQGYWVNKENLIQEWKKEPYRSNIDIQNIDDEEKKKKEGKITFFLKDIF